MFFSAPDTPFHHVRIIGNLSKIKLTQISRTDRIMTRHCYCNHTNSIRRILPRCCHPNVDHRMQFSMSETESFLQTSVNCNYSLIPPVSGSICLYSHTCTRQSQSDEYPENRSHLESCISHGDGSHGCLGGIHVDVERSLRSFLYAVF